MPATAREKIGRSIGLRGGQIPFFITGTNDAAEAKQAMLDAAPTSYDGFSIVDGNVEEVYEKSAADGIWEGTVSYASADVILFDPGSSSFTFDTGGGTQHLTVSKATRSAWASGGSVSVPFGGAIGVSSSGIEGVDLPVRQFNFTETHVFSDDQITPTYLQAIYGLTGKTNNAPHTTSKMGTFAIGELMLFRVAGGRRNDGHWELTFEFGASPNVNSFTVGSITVGTGSSVVKYGWDYVWVKYAESEDTTNKTIAAAPEFVIIERVVDAGNYALLNI